MSGICAILRLVESAPAEAETLAPILAGLAARGPDGSAVRTDGPAALGHALLATTPEAKNETMPLAHAETGCLITADVRLDNRDALIASLGLDPAGRVIGDGALILAAYLKWGMDCPEHLLGDFAFVIWDPRSHRLFAARDKVGMRQLIYHFAPGKLLACATDAEALIAHPQIPCSINEGRVADFLEQLEAIDHTSTFFQDVQRLPPAHALMVDKGALRVWRYWQLTPKPILRLTCDGDYEAAFLDVFTEAVRARLRSPDPVGSMLSGGMDSGSVAAVAARLLQQVGAPPLATFSGVDNDPACKESAGIRDSAALIAHIAPTFISLADPEAFRDEVIRLTEAESDPFDGHMALIRAIYLAARRAGIKVMLDGGTGDTTLATGSMVAHHLRQGRLLTAWAEARAHEQIWGPAEAKATTAFFTAARRMLIPASLRARRRTRWEHAEAERAAAESLIHPDLAARVDMPARRRVNALHVALSEGCDQTTQAQRMLHPYAIVGRERYDRVAGAIGIEPRDPFMDIRVLEFCLTLPPEQLHSHGWAKMILRRALAGQLPDSVRWKRGRDHVGAKFIQKCVGKRQDVSGDNILSQLGEYVNAQRSRNQFALQRSSDGVVSETDLLYLHYWLTYIDLYMIVRRP